MSVQTFVLSPIAQEDIVALWRRAVCGDRVARQAMLQRIMPRSTQHTPSNITLFTARAAQLSKEAA